MKSRMKFAASAASLFLLAGGILAKDKSSAALPMGGMPMTEMMGKTNMNCMATSDTLESLDKMIQEALKSDDKAKMRNALQRTNAHIGQMREHMSMCMGMMDMMGGMMGGDARGKMQGEEKPNSGNGRNGSEEHEQHHPK